MKIGRLDLTWRSKAAVSAMGPSDWGLSSRGGWWPLMINEPFPGAWQRNQELASTDVLGSSVVWACVTLIASDISKMRVKLIEDPNDNNIWKETKNSAYSPVLRKPNRYQNRIKFIERWILSKLIWGSTYVLKARDNRGGPDSGNVVGLYVLDPTMVTTLIAPDGSVYYQIKPSKLAQIDDPNGVVVPASEIIHDIMVPLYGDLCGVSPLYACFSSAAQALKIQSNSTNLFTNGSMPGGILSTTQQISNEAQQKYEKHWNENMSGPQNVGKVAVLGGGWSYTPLSINPADAQLIEQLKLTGEDICRAFHVPAYMVNVGDPPNYNNIEALNQQYYAQCLQQLIECFELCLDEGLELSDSLGVECDLSQLIRMDSKQKTDSLAEQIRSGMASVNEGRAEFDREPVEGGEVPFIQQQYWPISTLVNRTDAPAAPPMPNASQTPTRDLEVPSVMHHLAGFRGYLHKKAA
jgi:HK97 family phage portal protein